MQAGLRYEATGYDARQLGNIQVKDSAFSRNYDGLFRAVISATRPTQPIALRLRLAAE